MTKNKKKEKEKVTLSQLQTCLKYWDELNVAADVNNHVLWKIYPRYKQLQDIENELTHKPHIGSEITPIFTLGRAINNYKSFRACLESGQDFDPISFLPRVPKAFRGIFSNSMDYVSATYSYSNCMGKFLFPVFIHKWLNGKKVCKISNPEKIELVDLDQENYLSYLPYDSFILSLNTPLKRGFLDDDNKTTYFGYYSNILVFREDGMLKTLSIPNDVEKMPFTEDQLEAIKDVYSLSKNADFNKVIKALDRIPSTSEHYKDCIYDFMYLNINLANGKTPFWHEDATIEELSITEALKSVALEEGDDPADLLKNLSHNWGWNVLPFLLNGIGKVFANYVPSEEITLHDVSGVQEEESGLNENNNDFSPVVEPPFEEEEKQSWFEINPGAVTFIIAPKSKKQGQQVKIRMGREMPPHIRRWHPRNYRDELGNIIKTVRVKQATIRKDKIKAGQSIVGSVSEYR